MRFLSVLSLILLTGCAPLKTRYAGELSRACGKSLETRDHCRSFEATEALKSDADVVRAKHLCREFYEEALRSSRLLCAYFEEMDSLTAWGDGDDSPTLSAKGKRIHRRYSRLAPLHAREIERAYKGAGSGGSERALEELGKIGRDNLREEMECQGAINAAPGLMMIGLAAQAAREQKATYLQLQAALRQLAEQTSLIPERPFLALRTNFGIQKGGESSGLIRQKLASSQLSGPDLFALGLAEIPTNPSLEAYYAYSIQRSGWQSGELAAGAPRSGRGLASSRCAK